jgi:hypothetical protein
VTTTIVHDYGTSTNTRPIAGGEGTRTAATYVTVDDNRSQGRAPFYDAFDLSSIAGTITSLTLNLTIADAGPGATGLAAWFSESWRVYGTINGNTSTSAGVGPVQLGDPLVYSLAWTFLVDAGDVLQQAVTSGLFAFWFGDEAFGSNSLKLYDATLSVTSTTAAVPLPAGLPLLAGGLALLGMLGARRARRTVA